MTTVGKILVFVIMIFAVGFLFISAAVFTSAMNWKQATEAEKQKVSKLQKEISDKNTAIAAAKKDFEKAQTDHATTKKELDGSIGTLNSDIDRMRTEITTARSEVAVAQQNSRTALDEAEASRKEAVALREQKLEVEKQANDYKLRQAELNENIQVLTRERDVAKKNSDDLRDRSARASALLRRHGLSDDLTGVNPLDSPPPVQGEVARVDVQNQRIEMTIGSDDGLAPGHELFLFRTTPRPVYLGKIRVISVDPDQAVGKVIGTTIQGQKIKEGDIVSSTIRGGPRS